MQKKTAKPEAAKPNKSPNPIKAVATYSPRIIQGKTAGIKDLVGMISAQSSLSEGEIFHALKAFKTAILYHFHLGQAVKLDVLGTFTPQVGLDGTFSISHRPDKEIIGEINKQGWYRGKMKNRDMIGKSVEDLVDHWNEEHPDDPIA